MIQYYSPNFSFLSLIRSLFVFDADKKIIAYFKEYTGKKYILITHNCRTALYLAYKALPATGEVITNPLTCLVALQPIVEAGNSIKYTDIDPDTFIMQTKNLSNLMSENTIAIQATHQGGFLCNTAQIKEIIGLKKIILIEDCAQGFLSMLNNKKPGLYSDIACFSLIKNAFGIGGGILATDSPSIYEFAKRINTQLQKNSLALIVFRIVRNIIETNRKLFFFNFFYNKLMLGRKNISSYKTGSISDNLTLRKPLKLELKISWIQLQKAKELNQKRKINARLFLEKLKKAGLMLNYKEIAKQDSSFTKFFITHNGYSSESAIIELNKAGIEAKHLEQKFNQFYQSRLDQMKDQSYVSNIHNCSNYLKIHDSLISLPLTENMSEKDMDEIIVALKRIKRNEKDNMV